MENKNINKQDQSKQHGQTKQQGQTGQGGQRQTGRQDSTTDFNRKAGPNADQSKSGTGLRDPRDQTQRKDRGQSSVDVDTDEDL